MYKGRNALGKTQILIRLQSTMSLTTLLTRLLGRFSIILHIRSHDVFPTIPDAVDFIMSRYLLGIRTPVVCPPMAGACAGELAREVSLAGGFGIMAPGTLLYSLSYIRSEPLALLCR